MGWAQQANITGPEGPPGPGIRFQGTLPTVADLPTDAEPGDMWITEDDGHGWVWDGTEWVDSGQMQGSPGPPNVLSIGTVTTVPPGGSATSTITGTSPAQTLNLGIPRGDVGATGSQGPKGDTGATGSQGIQGPQGVKGDTGPSGTMTATIASSEPASPVSGQLWWHSTDKTLFIW